MSSYTVSKAKIVTFDGTTAAVSSVSGAAKGAAAGAAVGSAVPVIGNVVGGIVGGIVGAVGGLRKGNIAAARAEDKANQDKATALLMGSNIRDRNWGAEYIIKNLSFYNTELIAMAIAALVTGGNSLDYNDPLIQKNLLGYLKEAVYPNYSNQQAGIVAGQTASFVFLNPGYYRSDVVNTATAFVKTGGKSRDILTLAQPAVNVPAGTSANQVPTIQSVYGGPSEAGINKASMFSGKMLPIVLISGTVIAVAYKLFFEKKSRRKR
jgi:hypothetical protein